MKCQVVISCLSLQQVEVDGQQCMLEILDTAGTVRAVSLSLLKHSVCVPVSLTTRLSAGAVHSDERPVHEERPGLCSGLLHHGPVDLQRPPGPERADPQSEGHRGCTAHTENPDVTSCSTE